MTDTRQARANRSNRIAIGVLIAVVSLFCFLSDVGALGGVGEMVYSFLVGFFGLASYAYSLMGIVFGVALAFGLRRRQRPIMTFYLVGLLLIGIFALQIYTSSGHIGGASYREYLLLCYLETNTAGGMLFGLLAYPLMKLITSVGALAVACAAFLILAGAGLFPSVRRNFVYKAASPKERKKESEKAAVPAPRRRRRGEKVTAVYEPTITDFSQGEEGAKLYVVGIDGQPQKTTARKGARGYVPISQSFDPLYPNRDGGVEDEEHLRSGERYSAPAPQRETFAPLSPINAAREILFGSGPSEENIARYEAARKSGVSPMTNVGGMYVTPAERRQEMIDKIGGGEDPQSEYISRRRADSAAQKNGSISPNGEVDFEALKNESLMQWRNSPQPGNEPDKGARGPQRLAPVDDRKELARPTRNMPKVDESSHAPKDGGGTENVNVGMLGALNMAKAGEQPAAPVKGKKQEAEAEAYATPLSATHGAELARGEGQDAYTPVQKQGLDSVRYMPSNTTKLPRAFAGSAVDRTPSQPKENQQKHEPTPLVPNKDAQNTPTQRQDRQPIGKAEPYKAEPMRPVAAPSVAQEAQIPSEPIQAPRKVTGDKMSAAAIQGATDIAHLSGKDVESAEMDARIQNIQKSRGLTPAAGARDLSAEKAKASAKRGVVEDGPRMHQPTLEQEIKKAENTPKPKRPYVAPPLNLLEPPTEKLAPDDDIEEKKEKLINTLKDFDIIGEVESVDVGPTFTMYRVKVTLKKGISVGTVVKYAKDIAMKMEVESVRIQAPIPGKNAIGVEVPNKHRRTVNLSEILQSSTFNSASDPATFALGVDLYGTSHVARITKLPHLLIAGTTGAGKSCCVNSLIVSLLYKASPDDVRFIIVDPKRVELSVYAGIPHLLMDEIICEASQAVKALEWAVNEMERRSRYFQEMAYRNIEEYNADIKNSGLEKMPLIIIIIDEFGELMMTAKKEVEKCVGKIASLARALGIHLVLATQRPSVDVVSGTIRNNIPSRIAFRVSDSGSSRTILDTVGAEDLLGLGDMLYSEAGASDLKRIQGAYISNSEVKKVVEFVKNNNDCNFNEEAKKEIFANEKEKKAEPAVKERKSTHNNPDLIAALALGIELRETDGNSFSTSYIQRKLSFGYQKAARIVDIIKEMGYIGTSAVDSKKTVVTMTREEFEEFKASVEEENNNDEE